MRNPRIKFISDDGHLLNLYTPKLGFMNLKHNVDVLGKQIDAILSKTLLTLRKIHFYGFFFMAKACISC